MRVCIVHPDLNSPGGADAVCVNTIKCLQRDHEITLITNEMPDFENLATFFNVNIMPDNIYIPKNNLLNYASDSASYYLNFGLGRLKMAWLNKHASKVADDFDLIISTKNEISIDNSPTLQYIHAPQYTNGSVPGVSGSNNPILPLYNQLCMKYGGMNIEFGPSDFIICNSGWTAQRILESYNINAEVVYPPVYSPGEIIPFDKRENGFVCIGRITPNKRTYEILKIIENIIRNGFNIHIHIVGPCGSTTYSKKVKKYCRRHEWAYFEGKVERSRLNELIRLHKYGIHHRNYEHFGIAVAEMATKGVIPFVPNTGGQTEIVGNNEQLMYKNRDDAINKIINVLSGEVEQNRLSANLIRNSNSFTRSVFRDNIRKAALSTQQ